MTRRRFVTAEPEPTPEVVWLRALARGEAPEPAEPTVARPPQGARDGGSPPADGADAWLRGLAEAARTGTDPWPAR